MERERLRRTPALAIALVCVVVLAGCGGTSGGTDTTTTAGTELTTARTDTTTTEPPEPTTTHSAEAFAPGVTTRGIEDADALLAAHREVLLADGARVRLDVTRTAPNGTVVEESTQTVQLSANATPVVTNGSGFGPGGEQRVDAWLDETTSLFRFRGGGETEYRVLPVLQNRGDLVLAGNVGAYVSAAPDAFSVVAIEERGGRRVATLRAEADLVNDTAGPETAMEITVDSSGVVRSFSLTQFRPDGERYHLQYTVEATGITVERPAWVDAVPASVSLDVDLDFAVEDGAVLSIANDGTDAVPAGSTVTVVAGGVTYDATLAVPLDAGERVRVWVDAETGELTVGTEAPSPDAAQRLGPQVTVVVRSDDGIRLGSADLSGRSVAER